MSIQATASAAALRTAPGGEWITHREKLVLLLLSDCHNDDGSVSFSVPRLAEDCLMNGHDLYACLERLVALEILAPHPYRFRELDGTVLRRPRLPRPTSRYLYDAEDYERLTGHPVEEMLYAPRERPGYERDARRARERWGRVAKRRRPEVFARDDYTCQDCGLVGEPQPLTGGPDGRRGVGLVVDHFIPLGAAGSSELENLRTLCSTCNSRKAASDRRVIAEYRRAWRAADEELDE